MRGRTDADPDTSSRYEIRVAGELDPSWSGSLSDMALSYDTVEGGRRVTVLTGLLDQSALAGVLDTLFDLGLTVLLVQSLGRRTEH